MGAAPMRWIARRIRQSATNGGETDRRELKLVPFVAHTQAPTDLVFAFVRRRWDVPSIRSHCPHMGGTADLCETTH
jgi:hypothetical protein